MLWWWAVFFVSGCGVSSRSITNSLIIFLLMLSVRRLRSPEGGRRLILFILCVSTSLVIWTAAIQSGREEAKGSLTGGPPPFVESARERVMDALDDPRLSDRSRDLLSALLLGYRDRLDRNLRESYAYLGVAHFLALSGLHLGILAIPLVWVVSYLPIGRMVKSVCILMVLICYSILAGLPPSLVRATALAALFMIQRSMGRKTTLARSLVLAVFALVLIDEKIIHSGGFQLSCTAVLAIAVLGLPSMRMIRSRLRGRIATRMITFFLSPFVITISVNILTLPIQLLFFGRIPIFAPVYNLMMIIPVTLMLYLGLAYFVLPIGPVRAFVTPSINLIADILWDVPIRLSSNPQPAILSGSLCWPFYLAGTGLVVLSLRPGCGRRILCIGAAVALLAASFMLGGDRGIWEGLCEGGTLKEYRDLSKNSILLSEKMLVIEKDIGRWEAERIVKALWKMGIGRIETLLICPARLGRSGGVRHVVTRIEFTRVIISPYIVRHDNGLIELLHSRRIGTTFIERSDSLDAGGLKVHLIAPPYPPYEGEALPMDRACIRFKLLNLEDAP